MTTTAISKRDEGEAFVALQGDISQALAGVRAVIESEGRIHPMDLDRLRIPVGGVTAWQVPTARGDESRSTLDLIVLDSRRARAYWAQPFGSGGGGQPPDCASADGEIGVGTPGGDCMECPLAQFGSAPPGPGGVERRGKACREARQILVLLPESRFPRLLVLPPTSLRAWRQYQLRLVGEGLVPQQVVTRATLTRTTVGGFAVAVAAFSSLRLLEETERARVVALATVMSAALQGLRLEREDVEA